MERKCCNFETARKEYELVENDLLCMDAASQSYVRRLKILRTVSTIKADCLAAAAFMAAAAFNNIATGAWSTFPMMSRLSDSTTSSWSETQIAQASAHAMNFTAAHRLKTLP